MQISFSVFKVYDTDPSEIAYCMLGMSCPPSISKGSKIYPTSSWGLSCAAAAKLHAPGSVRRTQLPLVVRRGPRTYALFTGAVDVSAIMMWKDVS